MKPVNQQYEHNPVEGVYGDCHRACIASILELGIEDVPHFFFDNCDGDTFYQRVREWVKLQGYSYFEVSFEEDPREWMKMKNPDVYYILGCSLSSGVGHSVVCLNDQIVHDPLNQETGQIGLLDGHYWIDIIGAGKSLRNDQERGF